MANIYFLLQLVITHVVMFYAWRMISWAWLKPMRLQKHLRRQGFSGASYKLFYGDLKELQSSYMEANSKQMELSHAITARVLPFLHLTVEKYGTMCVQWFGPTPRVNITHPDLVKEIMVTQFTDIVKSKQNPSLKLFLNGVALAEGKKWVKQRKIMNAVFTPEKVKMMLPAFQESCNELVSKWKNSCIENSCEVDVWSDLQTLTEIAISRTAFGASYEEGHRVCILQHEQVVHFTQTGRSINLPGCRFLPTKRNKRMKEINREVISILRGIIANREEDMRNGVKSNTDLLGMLMEANMEDVKGNKSSKDDIRMTIDDIIEECKLFYFAGQETSAALILWTMVVLSMHQEWQQKARIEVLQVFGKRKPDYAELNSLKVVPMILYEILRLYPTVPSLTRITQKDIKIGEICLPAGVEIELPILMIHRDHTFWGSDADEFNPERFSEGISKATKNRLSFIPFGCGQRICVGQQFAMLEVKLAVSMILQSFSFELSKNYSHAPLAFNTLQPQYGALIILRKL